jgi:hypothetical protein
MYVSEKHVRQTHTLFLEKSSEQEFLGLIKIIKEINFFGDKGITMKVWSYLFIIRCSFVLNSQ